jgi:hypothetical protein
MCLLKSEVVANAADAIADSLPTHSYSVVSLYSVSEGTSVLALKGLDGVPSIISLR